MWKFDYKEIQIHREWNLDVALSMVDQWDGTLLYTSPDSVSNGQIILGLNPVFDACDNNCNTLEVVDALLEMNSHLEFPFLFGYVGYDAKHIFEEKGVYQNLIEKEFNQFAFDAYQYVLRFNLSWEAKQFYGLQNTINKEISLQELKEFKCADFEAFKVKYVNSDLSKKEYIEGVSQIQEYIKAGDVYQVNLTRKITCEFNGDAVNAAKSLIESNRIEFGVFYKSKDKYLISTSPERFFQVENNRILASPIKGTAGRGEKDEDIKNELLNDTKNLRELAMITDLLRNDISRICKPGSVKVKGFPILKTLKNVFHLVSDVEGELSTNSFSEIIEAIFPGGSITGCPKIRACQIIEELERKGRGPYTGSFGYVSGDNQMDFNILIRTVLINDNKLTFNVGGGITLLSNPEDEYLETNHKARNIVEALQIDDFDQ
ncbi:MAG: aminodeoxychorismate synthase, component I [Salinivirgaceae bacterium]|nr:MAG: aminodeoxychorismate synthase, component I [Salinivirgaceae bacterium]